MMYQSIIKIAVLLVLPFQALSFGNNYKFNSKQIINLTNTDGLELADDEGYLFLVFESDKKIQTATIKPLDSGRKIKLEEIVPGKNIAVFKVKAGQYYWDYFYYHLKGRATFNFDKDEKVFTVEPGVINYPGSWKAEMDIKGLYRAYLRLSSINESSLELKNLSNLHSELTRKIKFKFQGEVIDPYPEFLNKTTLKLGITGNSASNNYTYFEKMDGVYDETLAYKYLLYYLIDFDQSVGNLSPDGKHMLFQFVDKGITRIVVLNLVSYEMIPILQRALPKKSGIQEMEWIDNNSIYYNVLYDGLFNRRVSHLKMDADGALIGAEHLKIPIEGKLIDTLINEENKMYFSKNALHSKRKNGIYKIDTSTDKTIKKTTKKPFKVIKKLENAVYGLTASDGEVRFIITAEYNKKEEFLEFEYWFLHKDQKKWSKISSLQFTPDSNEEPILPILISKDLKSLYAITNKFSDKAAIHKFSTLDYSHDGVFYESQDFEITGIKIDPTTHDVIGVYYIENGFRKVEYFESENDLLLTLKKKYQSHKFYKAQHNKNTNDVLVYGTNEYSKGSWSIYNTKTQAINKLFELNPDYNKLEKGEFHTIKIKSDDGLDIEGYLVVPNKKQQQPSPLIVMPHGGPIGVRDYAVNNDIQHFFASQGIATLKVNYRGSGGFGKKFENSGYKQWGDKIESDINQMVDHVLNNYNLSEKSICSMGSSYGGYSAVMLTILYPDRYKCAVSHAGVMDLLLMFSSSDFSQSKILLESFKEVVGDPSKEHDIMISKSPVYLAEKADNPILLFHGARDKRVTFEHSRRMNEFLNLYKKNSNLIVFTNEGHSFNDLESKIVYVARSLNFIKKSLQLAN